MSEPLDPRIGPSVYSELTLGECSAGSATDTRRPVAPRYWYDDALDSQGLLDLDGWARTGFRSLMADA